MDFLALAAMAVMTTAGVWFADRHLTGRKWLLGFFFGSLAVAANTASVLSVARYGIALSLRDAPVIAAALFFGPVPGVIAGAIAAVERALTPLWGVGSVSWCPMATFLVALIAASIRKWFLDGRRPYLLQSVFLGIILEAMHLSFDVFMGISRLARSCEIVFSAFVPESVFVSTALVLSCVVTKQAFNCRKCIGSRANQLIVAYFACCAISIGSIIYYAETDSRKMAMGVAQRMEDLFSSQIDMFLHQDAVWIANRLKTLDGLSHEAFMGVAADSDYDELNAVGRDGRVIDSTDEGFVGMDFHNFDATRPYISLLEVSDGYVSEQFRHAIGNPSSPLSKYVGVSMPDRSGFIQIGFYRSRLEKEFKRFFFPIFDGVMNFFETDYNIITSIKDDRVVLANGGHDEAVGRTGAEIGLRLGHKHARLFGEWCHIGTKDVGEWRIYCVVPLVESYGEAMVICSLLVVLLFALVFGFRIVMLRFRRQQSKIEKMRKEADDRRRQDMEMASKIQMSSLPIGFPSRDGFSLFAKMRPAREVGGDFYDYYPLSDGRLVFAIADVSGKGVPAAMFMMKAKAMLKSSMYEFDDPAVAVARTNDGLAENNEAEMFVTAWIGVFDPVKRTVDYVNAGHNPPLVKRADGSVEWLRSRSGSALAVFTDCRYRVESISLAPGDSLLLYTDGVTEAQNAAGEFYGEDRLEKLLATSGELFVDAIFEDVAVFAGEAEQADDITALALDLKK